MFTNLVNENSVSKLSGLLKSKFGVDLRVTSMLQGLELEAGDSKCEVRGGTLYVTICAEGQYLGTAIMAGAERLSAHDVSMASEMVKMVLEPTLLASSVRMKEQQFLVSPSTDDHADFSNVIELFQTDSPENLHMGPEFLSSLLLLESNSAQTIQKVSVHIHELGGRWALINYKEIRSQVKSLRELRELGAMTIVVDDLAQLSQPEQNLLASFAEESNAKSEPLILVGTSVSLSELFGRGEISQDLLHVLMANRLELDRFPRDFRKLQESLQLFLDRKAMLT